MSFLTSEGRRSKWVETLERRLALGAPLALTDDGLAVSAPSDEAWLDPGINESQFASADSTMTTSYYPPPPPPMTQPPFSYTNGSITGGSTFVREDEIPSPGFVRFEVRSNFGNGAPAPTSATMNWNLSGDAAPGVDYTGPLTAGSVNIPLDASGFGFKNVEFTAFDDPDMEVDENIVVTVTGGSVSSGTFSASGSFTSLLKSDDAEASDVEIDSSATAPPAEKDLGSGTVKSPDNPRLWKIKKTTTTTAAGVKTEVRGAIEIHKQEQNSTGNITKMEYKVNTTGTPGTTTVYDVELISDDSDRLKAPLKVTVKF